MSKRTDKEKCKFFRLSFLKVAVSPPDTLRRGGKGKEGGGEGRAPNMLAYQSCLPHMLWNGNVHHKTTKVKKKIRSTISPLSDSDRCDISFWFLGGPFLLFAIAARACPHNLHDPAWKGKTLLGDEAQTGHFFCVFPWKKNKKSQTFCTRL